MDKQRVTLLVLLDLSAIFDTVNHQVLFKRLESTFGISGTALSWFKSYLDGRSQRICVEGCCSTPWCPSRSLSFTIYASKLFETVKARLPDVHAYADDTHLYLSFKPDSEDNQTEAVDAGQECIKDISAWMAADQLKLNEDKTEVILLLVLSSNLIKGILHI